MAGAIGMISAGISAAGAIRQGNVAESAAEYNAQVAENNAEVVRAQGTLQQEAQRAKARALIGDQLAAVSSSGTSVSGSNLQLLGESLYNAELDALNIRYESELNARGLQSQATQERWQGKQAKIASGFNAAAQIGKGFSSYASAGGSLNGG